MKQSIYLVAGTGQTGLSIAHYLQRRNQPFVVFDTRLDVAANVSQHLPFVDIFTGELPADIYPQLKAIIASPGVAIDHPVFQEARRLEIPIFGDIECLAREISVPVIAITGTNGKSTVTTLVGDMAKAAGLRVAVAGNIGVPCLDLLDDGQDYDLWVLELSSFQLDLLESLAPIAATILNVSPDHLDRHHSYEAYLTAKHRIYRHAKTVIYNRDDLETYPGQSSALVSSFGLDEASSDAWGIVHQDGCDYLALGQELILAVNALRLKGKHNWQNALAACALARSAGIDMPSIIEVLTHFSGLPHRCQWIRTLDGVDWINDSKGTNIGATVSALNGIGSSMNGKIILIAGGLGKGADFRELAIPISEHVRSLVLIGTDAKMIALAVGDSVPIFYASTLSDAMLRAKTQALTGDVVLLSPACASQDMFRDFNHRGEMFASLAEAL